MKRIVITACALFIAAGMAHAAVDPMDENFIKTAAHDGAMAVEFGNMSVTKASNADVKKLAELEVAEHAKANEEIKTMAGTMAIATEGWHPDYQAMHDKLNTLQGAEFDRAYVNWVATSHTKCLDLVNQYIQNGKHEQIKTFATKMQPALKNHMSIAQSLQSTLGKGALLDKPSEQPMNVSTTERESTRTTTEERIAAPPLQERDKLSSHSMIRDERSSYQRTPLNDPAYDVRYEQRPLMSDPHRAIDTGTCGSPKTVIEQRRSGSNNNGATGSAGSGFRAGFTRNVYE